MHFTCDDVVPQRIDRHGPCVSPWVIFARVKGDGWLVCVSCVIHDLTDALGCGNAPGNKSDGERPG